jgi:hypothetical protein
LIFFNSKKEIVVFVKNKLISTDTVLPILIEAKEKFNISSIVVVFDKIAHDGIKKNIVINDAINYVGRELYASKGATNKIIRKINILISFFGLFLKFIRGCKIFHFGLLDEEPFRVIGVLFRKNIYLLQSDSFKHTYDQYNHIVGQKDKEQIMPVGDNIVAFNNAMGQLYMPGISSKNLYHFGPTRTRKTWIDFSKKHSKYYFSKYHYNVDLSNGCIVLIVSFFGKVEMMNNPESTILDFFHQTVDVLSDISIPVFIKPHVFSDMKIVNDAIHGKKGFYITYLHPTILALKARAFICNSYSTIMADVRSLGVTTIEYTDYKKEILIATNNKSIGYQYVDYFINNNRRVFSKTVERVLLDKYVVNNYQGRISDSSGLLNNLSR